MVTLRRILRSDLPKLFEWRNSPEVYRWCRQYAPLHWLNHEAWYEKQAADPRLEMFSVVDPYNDIIGVCGLTDIDLINSRAEFSLYIGPEHQKKGYGKDALLALFSWGFSDLGLNRIWGETFEGNPARSTFEAIGMETEGVRKDFYRYDGRFINAHLYSISAQSFNHLHRLNESKGA